MNYKSKRGIVILFNLAFVFGIYIATNWNKWMFILISFYLCGTLLGSFFGFYTCKIFDEVHKSGEK